MLDAIDWIPSSRTEPAQFDHATEIGRALLRWWVHPDGTGIRGRVFFNSKQQWQSYDRRIVGIRGGLINGRNSEDYLQALFDDLILRILLQHLNRDDPDAEAHHQYI